MEQTINFDFLEIEIDDNIAKMAGQVINECFKMESIKNTNIILNIIFTTPEVIRDFNKKYRNIDKATDVLSFPMFDKADIEELILSDTPDILGDIVISIEQVKNQAIDYGHSFERELSYMLVHGFYHLLGYDHIDDNDKSIMRQKEEQVLEKLELIR